MIWKVLIVITVLIISMFVIVLIIGFKDFFSYMLSDDDADFYREELAAMENENKKNNG